MSNKLAQAVVTQREIATKIMEREPVICKTLYPNIDTTIEARLSIKPNQNEGTVTIYRNGTCKGIHSILLPCSFVSVQVHAIARAYNDLADEMFWLSKCTLIREAFLEKRSKVFELLEITSLKEITTPYTDIKTADLCYKLACKFHEGQLDKADRPYIEHPVAVAKEFSDECLQSIALLHDVLEDTDCTPRLLRSYQVPETVITSVDNLTHKDGVDYQSYVNSLVVDPCAIVVKIADLSHNMDLTRLKFCDVKAYNRCLKYNKAIEQIYNALQVRGGKLQWQEDR